MTTPPPIPNLPAESSRVARLALEPMLESNSPIAIIEALLKRPGRILYELQHNWRAGLSVWLLIFALGGMAAYGIVVGSFSGGAQIWFAPAKLGLGTFLSMLICLPSLYIFGCLSGIETRLRIVSGMLFAAVALCALLLIGLAPVAWIFSQSTDSVAFMGALHIALWVVGITFGLRLIGAMGRVLSGSGGGHLKLWGFIFIVVCLQMMTTLRPIIGTSGKFLPSEKKFFLAHWYETVFGTNQKKK